MSDQPPVCDFDWPAPDFELPGIDGNNYRLTDIKGPNGTLVMFICNHCPYVKAVADRIARDCARARAAWRLGHRGHVERRRQPIRPTRPTR